MIPYTYFIDHLTINSIYTTHPQTIVITLISPQGTSLTLSAYNGAGGSNYINTTFQIPWATPITSGTAPFTGTFEPQGPGGFSVFDYENGDGTWQLCIEDTLQDTLTAGFPGPYMNSFGGGTMGFGSTPGPPPCAWTWNIWNQNITICSAYNLNDVLNAWGIGGGWFITNWTFNGNPVPDPTAITSPGIYHVHIDDGMGCMADADITVNYVAPPSLGSDQSFTVCGPVGVNLNTVFPAQGSFNSWLLNNVLVTGTSLSNATTAGVYTLYSTNVPGNNTCYDTATVTITNTPLIFTPQVAGTCNGVPIDLTTVYNTTGLNVTWTFGGIPVANPAAVSTGGIYTMTASNAAGCTATTTVTLTAGSGPALGPDLSGSLCTGSSLDLTTQFPTGTAATTWTLNNNPVANPSAVTQAGTYHLVATDLSGCTDEADYVLSVNPNPNLGPNQNLNVCAGSIVDLTTVFNLSGLNAAWTYGGGNPVPNPSAVTQSGSYNVTVTDPNGCTDFAQVMVAYSAAMNLGSNQWVDICAGTSYNLTTAFSTGGWTTQWQLNGVNVVNPAAVTAAGVYTITATNGTGCTGSAQLTLTVQPAPVLPGSQTISMCNGNSTDIASLYNTSGLNASWTLNSQPVLPPVNAVLQGDYTITATNLSGCSASSTVTLNVLPKPNLGNDQSYIYCSANAPVDLSTYFLLNGLNAAWTLSGNAVSNMLVSVTGDYQVIATNTDGCADTAVLQLRFDPSITLGADQQIVLCPGEVLDLTTLYATAGYTTSWTFNSSPVANPAAVNAAGTYQLTATATNMCGDDALVQLSYSAPVNLGPAQDYTLCSWMTLDLNSLYNSAGLNFSWTYNGQAITNVSAVHDSGTYLLTATNANGCTGTSQVNVHDGACRCEADFTANAKCTEAPATFKIISDSTILAAHWHFSNGAAEDNYELEPALKIAARADSITVTLVAQLSCGADTVEKKIKVDACAEACHIYFPNAFSPNEDGLNDQFVPVSDCTPDTYSLQIFNRYGQVVFATNTLTKSWDGNYEQEGMDEIYVYKVKYQFPFQKEKTESGRFTVIH